MHLFKKYPHANTYRSASSSRIPGTISVHHPVINLYGQDFPGKELSNSHKGRQRIEWFRQGLDEIDSLMQTIVAPAVGMTTSGDYEQSNEDNIDILNTEEKLADDGTENCICSKAIGTLYFPYQIGCGLAGGDWNTYRSILFEWSHGKPYNVHIISLP